jgi:hypothetical protein
MSLFKGRDDLYAKRWESKEGRSGYAPVCLNEWKHGVCGKPEVKCAFCEHRSYAALDGKVIEAHLRGNLVAGIYPLRQDEKCHFLAIDFDKDGWQQDVSTLQDVCTAFAVPVAIERSRSGSFPAGMRWFLLNKLFQMRPAEIARMEGVKNPSAVRGLIIRVSDQLTCGEISLFEKDPEAAEAAKARLEAKRAKRRENHAKNKEEINAKRREAYAVKKTAES